MKQIIIGCLLYSLSQGIRLRDESDDLELQLYADTIANNNQKEVSKIKQKGTVLKVIKENTKEFVQTKAVISAEANEANSSFADAVMASEGLVTESTDVEEGEDISIAA